MNWEAEVLSERLNTSGKRLQLAISERLWVRVVVVEEDSR